ncbi:MAG: hypothetical protein JW829_13565 [Pirellulales bacterium]|nr:hypothetical protein [Pirellulales bacterium]
MEINRNQWFMIGLVTLLIGLQFRAVSAYVLNEEATKFLAERAGKTPVAAEGPSIFGISDPVVPVLARKVIRLPDWSGWFLLSVGAVLVLHSFAMKRPGT